VVTKIKEIRRAKSLTETVADNLRESIINGSLSFGLHLSEVSLAEAFGVSKTPVREALFVLKKEGLIDIIPQKGSFVFNPQKDSVIELCNYRGFIEPIAMEESVKHAPTLLLKELEACTTKMEKKYQNKEYKEFLALDDEFHQLFFNHCNNQFLQQSYHLVSVFIGALRSNLTKNDDIRFDLILNEHKKIVEQINNKQIKEAKNTIFQHVVDIKEVYQTVIN
jgi:DNA-binding GntR family transcriptional regulator